LVGDECDVVGGRSFRGTWEPTPPAPTGLEAGAETKASHRPFPTGCAGLPSVRPLTGARIGSRVTRVAPPGFWPASAEGGIRGSGWRPVPIAL